MSRKLNYGYYALRWKILTRDNYTCQYCGQHAPNVKLEVDHIIPVEDGGSDIEDNLNTSCYACNRGKSGLRIISTRSNGKKMVSPLISASPFQDKILEYLKDHSNSSVKEITSALDTSYSNTSVGLHHLVEKGLVQRVAKGIYKR